MRRVAGPCSTQALAQRAVLLDDAPVEGQDHRQGVISHFRVQ